MIDNVNHPVHYRKHPSGVECIDITAHMNFCLGNATKYIWRAGLKNDAIEDLRKAVWYLEKEIEMREIEKLEIMESIKEAEMCPVVQNYVDNDFEDDEELF